MTTIDHLKIGLIDRIKSIDNKSLLERLEHILTSMDKSEGSHLSIEQLEMLAMSEDDIEKGDFVSQEIMSKRNSEWLNAL